MTGALSNFGIGVGRHVHGFAWPCSRIVKRHPLRSIQSEAGAKTGHCRLQTFTFRNHPGHNDQDRADFHTAVAHFASYLEYVEREMPAEERDGARIDCVKGELQEARARLPRNVID